MTLLNAVLIIPFKISIYKKIQKTAQTRIELTCHDSAIHDASVYVLSGQVEVAIETLEEWAKQGSSTSVLEQYLRTGLGALENDPRYQAALQTVQNRMNEQKARLSEWEAGGEMAPIPSVVSDPGYSDSDR